MALQPGDQIALEHGGAGAVRRISKGMELIGMARDAELAVYAEVEQSGRDAIVMRNAARLQAACDLYWQAVAKAAQEGDLEKIDRYVARFGWLASASLRAWALVKAESEDGDGRATARQVLDAILGGKNGKG